ncbi:MAG TPA: translation initiation factor IF-2 [Actinobacteria bacterium]|nr:translation initiation factor IF-2 [Actinomycetota bacterium]
MNKVRVHELAKEVGLSSAELIKKLDAMGIRVKNHFATLEESTVERFRASKDESAAEGKSAEISEKPKAKEPPELKKKTFKELRVPEGTTVKEFAMMVGKSPTDLIKILMRLGEMVTINQPLSHEAINVLADEFGYEAHIIFPEEMGEEYVEAPTDIRPRSPVVTVMGHVDHGKTSLLDVIRKTDVISQEFGGITQHIGAYQVVRDGRKITFIDTPGHEAFTAMRARGAKVTDIAVLVIAADDGVMPQTIEAIDHARAANVPILVAINKIDKPEANPEKVKKQLTEHNLAPEEWGGHTVFVEVSAKQKINIEELLEMILLVADMRELEANYGGPASGVAIEAKLDKGRGPVATVLVHRGTLRVGNAIVAGLAHGKVRAMMDDKGNQITEATPAMPVEVLGLSSVPQAGDEVKVVADEKAAREIAEERALKRRVIEMRKRKAVTLDNLFERIKEGEVRELNLVIKGDAQGSIEALKEALEKIGQDEVRLNVIHKGVGAISETDVMLAAASNAIIIGFNVRPGPKAKELATREQIDLRTYRVIYQVIEDIETAKAGLLKPKFEEVELGRADVRATFKVSKVGTVAGAFILDGEIERGSKARMIRDGVVIYEGSIASLRRFKEDVPTVKAGFECGIGLENFQDIKVGDMIETFTLVEKSRE